MQWRIQDFSEEGAPRYEFAKFSQKLHEIERIWTPGGGGTSLAPPLDPPLWWIYMVKFWTRVPLLVQFTSFSCNFRHCTPGIKKSWIRRCVRLKMKSVFFLHVVFDIYRFVKTFFYGQFIVRKKNEIP